MALAPGTRLGPYEIVSALGAGGMGEVYRATDTTLGRQVAIKVLPDAFAQDAERLARFEREAKTLASLNHPHIAQIYGLEKSSGVQALVMELVEGEDVSQWIAGGPIPLDEALPIATQIAEALEAAHEKGIIHRDLKPANIKVASDGVVKVLDFGLAKLAHPEVTAGHADVTTSPTVASPAVMTGMGVLLGTAAYMAPEQAKGREADKRSDIWAFGCVVYEMLTGRRPFAGEHVIDALANVLTIDPDWSALPSETPPAIRTLLQRCLAKDRRRRVADISTALFVLENGASLAPPSGTVSAAPLPRTRVWWRAAALTGGAGVVALVAGTLVWFATRPDAARVTRTTIAASGATALTLDGVIRDLAITPDGSRVIYVGHNGTQLFVRALDALEPVAVYSGAPRGPFVSPDGQSIGFVDGTIVLKKVAVTGGPAVMVAPLDGTFRGATWGPDNTIIFATNNLTTGLQRVAAAGGTTTVLTRPDPAQGERNHSWPEMLPGGRAVLFTITARTGGLDAAQVVVLDLQTGTRTVLVRGGSHPQYVSSGHLVYAAAGTLRAVAFDVASLKTHGTPVAVVPQVMTTPFGAVDAVVATDGTLAYISGGGAPGAGPQRTPVWVDRQGRETLIPVPSRSYLYPRLSLDGRRGALAANDQDADIWVWDLSRPTLTRVTVDPGLDLYPVWTPNGRRLFFSSDRDGARNLYWQAADGSDAAERLTDSPNQQNANSVTADSRLLIFTETVPKTGEDVMQVALDGTRRVTPLVHSNFTERNGMVSPDGRWLAYEANESGPFEIYVRPFPDVNSGRWPVSTAGGTRPLWAQSGQELFYAAPTSALMRVGVEHASSWAASAPTLVVKEGYVTVPGGNPGRTYDISPDGQRFLMIKEGSGTDQAAVPPQVILVQHWTEELKRLVPAK